MDVITPIFSEDEWRKALTHLPPLQLTADRVVFVAPHPDDETLGAGALLANLRRCGAEVTVMAVTDGENAYADHASLAEIRRQEQIAALGHLKIDSAQIHRLGLTDSAVALQRQKVVDSLLPLVTSDTCILAPWIGDFHPDHEACGWAAQQAARRTGAALCWYFFWTWHRGTPAAISKLNLCIFNFDDLLLETKLRALACHRSQLHREDGDPILPDYLLGPAKRNFEVFARA